MKFNRSIWRVLIFVVAIGYLIYKFALGGDVPPPTDKCALEDRKSFNELVFTDHARCRMKCRGVSEGLLEDVYSEGQVNCGKSGPKNGDMRYALELEDPKGDVIRMIVEDEKDKHIVITVIRIGGEDSCECS